MKRAIIHIHGIVQGVGFRPFVHRLVTEYGLSGFIRNTSSGVELELEGGEDELRSFAEALPERAPRLAVIDKLELTLSGELKGYEGFRIIQSKTEASRNTLLSPDISVCEDCRRELFTPGDRRYRYPFINCTNCGPRFTIIRDVPYDRPKTAMGAFPMCGDCAAEYGDITNRRYHAQPDCCPDCGPRVFYLDAEGREQPGDGIENARTALKAGKIIAVKGLGGMHLACRCDDPELLRELRRRKQRDEKPFAVMCRDVNAAKKICRVSEAEEKILTGFRRPIVLLEKKQPGFLQLSDNRRIGVMLPYTPLHYLLFGEDIDMLVMTSANLSDTPIMYQNEEALRELRGIADGFLLHNRDIVTRCDDSLCWVLDGAEYFARRSRGYVPFPVKAEGSKGMLLACGAEQKASFCLSKDELVFPCQHIGDLKNQETLSHYEQQIAHFERMFDIKPTAIACDLHPDYLSTAYAEERAAREGIPLIRVQHHHAHMAACMADNGLKEPVIGLIWDGTGYGTDGSIWGGECLIGDYAGFQRFGTIRSIPLPGGDRCTKELTRTAYALLREADCPRESLPDAPVLETMLERGLNSPKSSGMGRLFDGFAALLGICTKASYEGQGAVLLEAAAAEGEEGLFPYELQGAPLCFDWAPMVREALRLQRAGTGTDVLAARFLNTLADMAVKTCLAARAESGLNAVVLSGGSFQNMYLMEQLPRLLRAAGFRVYCHRRVSCNDEGLSLGQLRIAQTRLGAE